MIVLGGFDFLIDGIVKANEIITSGDPNILAITLLSLRVSLTATLIGALWDTPRFFDSKKRFLWEICRNDLH